LCETDRIRPTKEVKGERERKPAPGTGCYETRADLPVAAGGREEGRRKGLHPELSLGKDSFKLPSTQRVKLRGLAICAGVKITPEAGQKYN